MIQAAGVRRKTETTFGVIFGIHSYQIEAFYFNRLELAHLVRIFVSLRKLRVVESCQRQDHLMRVSCSHSLILLFLPFSSVLDHWGSF